MSERIREYDGDNLNDDDYIEKAAEEDNVVDTQQLHQQRRLLSSSTASTSNVCQNKANENEGLENNDEHDEDEWTEDADNVNDTTTVKSNSGNMHVVASHYNELKEAGRKERLKSRIFYMRNFNNWIKSQLISEYLGYIKEHQRIGDPMRILDMCCGKGGDLLKWEKAMITHLICTDIAEVSVEQCKKRYEDIYKRAENSKFSHKFTAEFFVCDSTLVRLRERFKDPSMKLNLVSCQFAFHYSFESLTQADCMVRNAAECLQPGGFFIATIPDAYEIMKRLRQSDRGRTFGNDLYKIEFISHTDPPPLFGAKYQFHLDGVVDCPEFLVHFPTLMKLACKHGLKLVRKTTFAEYYAENMAKGRSLLHRMNGLELVYVNRLDNNEEYAHVRKHLKGSPCRSIGTLSKSEWEAATLYLVCAFRKCKNTWNSEGRAVFNFDD